MGDSIVDAARLANFSNVYHVKLTTNLKRKEIVALEVRGSQFL